jgi:hypothetical protein
MSGDHTGMVAFAGLSHSFAEAYARLFDTSFSPLDYSLVSIKTFFLQPCLASQSVSLYPFCCLLAFRNNTLSANMARPRSISRPIAHSSMTSGLLVLIRLTRLPNCNRLTRLQTRTPEQTATTISSKIRWQEQQ